MSENELPEGTIIHQPCDYNKEFNPNAYLDHFYSQRAVNRGLKLALFAIPNFIAWLPKSGNGCRLLDVGSGPTIYVALCFRSQATDIYLTDYTQSSRDELNKWLHETSTFDWLPVVKSVALVEGVSGVRKPDLEVMEKLAKSKTRAVWFCDVHMPGLVKTDRDEATHESFDIVTSIFCLESACTDYEQYKTAMCNIVNMIKPDGHFILGSVLEDTIYQFGKETFHLLYLTKDDIFGAMQNAGLNVENVRSYEHDGAFMIMAQKL